MELAGERERLFMGHPPGRLWLQPINQIRPHVQISGAGPTAPARGLCLQWVRYDLNREYPVPPHLREGELVPLAEADLSAPADEELDEPA